MRATIRVMSCAAIAVLSACGSGGDGATGTNGVVTVALNASSLTMLQGQTAQLQATALDAAGAAVVGAPAATWRTSNANVATVSGGGTVTGVAPGGADITATIAGKSASLRATVSAAPNAVTVSMPGLSFTPFRATIRVAGRVNYEFPSLAHNVIFDVMTGAPPDIQVTSNQTVARIFGTAGVFKYDCRLHPGMSGEVEVVP